MNDNIYNFITTQENEYLMDISINGWDWGMKEHIRRSFYYKHGRMVEGDNENDPTMNITRPLINLQYRAEDIDVKDIVLYVDDPQYYYLSFLIKKYHDDVFLVENNLDEFIDDANESKVDYGLALVKEMSDVRPEVVDLQSIAFCDQTDILKGPIGIKHYYNPAELKEMEAVGWGNEANGATVTVDELIQLSEQYKEDGEFNGRINKTPTNYIEIYEVHGVLPVHMLDDSDSMDFIGQFHIVGFYKDAKGERQGVTLFRKKETKSPFKALVRDKIFSRSCGFGGVEELFKEQEYTNLDVIRINDMLDAASKTVFLTNDPTLVAKHPTGMKNMENMEFVEEMQGGNTRQLDTFPRNLQLFENALDRRFQHAQLTASAQDPLLGKEAPSGTPFRAQERQVMEGKGLHEYRRGKFAKFLEEVYRDWIIPHIVKKVTQGTEFLSELSTEEMQYIADKIVENKANKLINDRVLETGIPPTDEEVQLFKEKVKSDFVKGGNKRFLKILKGEFKNKAVRVKINIAGKQKDLALMTDKLVNIFRQIIANPQGFQQVMQIPAMSKTFNDILEYSGLTPVYYTGMTQAVQAEPMKPELEVQQPQNATT